MTALADLVPRLSGLRVVVVGEAVLDVFVEARRHGRCREAPAPVVRVDRHEELCGGAANAAANAAALGAEVRLVTVTGDDDAGERLGRSLERAGVDTEGVVRDPAATTVAKRRIVADGDIVLRVDEGRPAPPDARTEARLVAALHRALVDADAVLVSDYGYGVVGDGLRTTLGAARAEGRPVVVDAHDAARYQGLGATAVKPNYDEALRLIGGARPVPAERRAAQVARLAPVLHERTGAGLVAVTLDRLGGVLLTADGPPHPVGADPAPDANTTGAGDTFAAAFTLGLAAGAAGPTAMDLASAAAQQVVRHPRTAVCPADELADALGRPGPAAPDVADGLRPPWRPRGTAVATR